MLKKSVTRHRPWRVTREIGEKGATWTDWALTTFGSSRSSRLSRAAILQERSSVSSSHDKLNGMKRLKRRVGYEEMKARFGVPNGTFKVVAQSLTFRIEGSAR